MLNGLSERTFFSFCFPHAHAEGCPKALAPSMPCVPAELPWVTLGIWASQKAPFVHPRHLPSWHLKTLTLSLNLVETSLFSTCFHHLLIGKTSAFLLSKSCLSLLSSVLSLPQEKIWILFLCSFYFVGRILSWVSSCWCCISSLCISVNLTHVMYSGLVSISGAG